jgi:hypothetical protein
MRLSLRYFIKGMLIGLLLLPLEFTFLSFSFNPVHAQDSNLREEIRSETVDIRDELRDMPCEEDGRESCARSPYPRPSHREPCIDGICRSPQPSFQPSPGPSDQPGVSPSPSPGDNGNGGDNGDDGVNGDDNGDDGNGGVGEGITPAVLGLSFTGS